jgi:hypothetical protein
MSAEESSIWTWLAFFYEEPSPSADYHLVNQFSATPEPSMTEDEGQEPIPLLSLDAPVFELEPEPEDMSELTAKETDLTPELELQEVTPSSAISGSSGAISDPYDDQEDNFKAWLKGPHIDEEGRAFLAWIHEPTPPPRKRPRKLSWVRVLASMLLLVTIATVIAVPILWVEFGQSHANPQLDYFKQLQGAVTSDGCLELNAEILQSNRIPSQWDKTLNHSSLHVCEVVLTLDANGYSTLAGRTRFFYFQRTNLSVNQEEDIFSLDIKFFFIHGGEVELILEALPPPAWQLRDLPALRDADESCSLCEFSVERPVFIYSSFEAGFIVTDAYNRTSQLSQGLNFRSDVQFAGAAQFLMLRAFVTSSLNTPVPQLLPASATITWDDVKMILQLPKDMRISGRAVCAIVPRLTCA